MKRVESEDKPKPKVDENPKQSDTPQDTAALGTKSTKSELRAELPKDISKWNVQTITQGSKKVHAVMTEKGPVPLTPEELEMYKKYSSGQKKQENKKLLGDSVNWFKQNMTGTQKIHK